MAKFAGLSEQQGHSPRRKKAVLLINLGTPDAPTSSDVRRYLAEFLSDHRVVEIPKLVWKVILHGIILRTRPAKSAALYKSIWTEQGSPLLDITRKQSEKLQQYLSQTNPDVEVHYAMRYGNPSIASVLKSMHETGVDDITVLPLYPQYAAPTTASSFDAISKELMTWRYLPSLQFIHTYHDHPDYINALVESIKNDFEKNGKPKKLVLSYHGMPKRNLTLGDPYYCFCKKTTRLVVESLGLHEDDYITTFQSRFGKAEWLKPYTDATLEELAQNGVDDVAVICPAFSADCLETLEEIQCENKEVFEEASGKHYRYIPALNDDELHIEMMANIVRKHL
ncbi:ferrochelatase [Parashewanella curva]|uniref:Ferrochelatase n=1 Tax=Parashewanella curva TaxID=2338552 RepID=A0A3L8Q310_9GAMM|nr:ferrochelatase [Parashewanella curva]RLV61489.1 ferrochelatase [Parashewanella curva]